MRSPSPCRSGETARSSWPRRQLADEAIVGKLAEVAKQGLEERIFVRGDKRVDYGRVAQVMSIVTSAGYKRVALVTEPDQR